MQAIKTTQEIKDYLLNRYLNGYSFTDQEYPVLVEKLVKKAKEINNGISLIDRLYEEIGEYTAITAQIYMDVAEKYLYKFKLYYKRHPSASEIFNFIGTHNA